MTGVVRVVFTAAALTAPAAWAGTSFISTWKAPDAQPGTFQGKKVVTLFVSQEEALRRGVEQTLAYELTKRGMQGVAAHTLVPTADIRDEEKAKARILASGAAGVVALRLVGRDQEMTSSPAMYYAGPSYGGFWGGYWGYSWGGVYDPGYLRTETILHVETLIYSLEQNKLIWAGQSKTTNPKNADELIQKLLSKVASEMKKQGLVQKGK
jgi:hypothetical protein